jgi:hypothetical protein
MAMMRSATILTAAGVLAMAVMVCAAAQKPATSPAATTTRAASLPPVLQTCPMHPDVVEEKPGTCPLCRMALVPVRLESVWSCPLHAAVTRSARGACPICGRELVQMTMALTWTCKGHPEIDVMEPARCPDGTAMIAKRTLRPHGNHNPQHGGQFFMAPDNTHHLEGTLPSTRLFRVYLYDDYARPLPAARLKQVRGHLDIAGRSIPLSIASATSSLEARLDTQALPTAMTAKLQLEPDKPEYRFDFAFPAVTKDPVPSVIARPRAAAPAAPAKPAASTPSSVPEPSVDPALIQVPIPAAVPDILTQMRLRDGQVRGLIERGNLPAIFVPAFQARDLAIALEAKLDTLPSARRDVAGSAIVQLVRAAWMLDASGDIGNREQALVAYGALHEAAIVIDNAFARSR